MVFLKKGPNRSQDSVTAAKIQEAHLENIGKQVKSGKMVMAGPFMDDGNLRGLFLYDCPAEEAKGLIEMDPAIVAGRLSYEMRPWYGPKFKLVVE